MIDTDKVYDASYRTVNINDRNILAIAIGNICFGPFRLIGRVLSNLCLLPRHEVLNVLRIAFLFELAFLITGIFVAFRTHSILFLFGCIADVIVTAVAILFVKRTDTKGEAPNNFETKIDKEAIEVMCNSIPEKLDSIIEEANL